MGSIGFSIHRRTVHRRKGKTPTPTPVASGNTQLKEEKKVKEC